MNNAGEESLYLGNGAGGTVSSTIQMRGSSASPRSRTSLDEDLVTASATSQSYLWHKVIGDQNSNGAVANGCAQAATACTDCTTNAPCGATEPYLGAPLARRPIFA